MTINTKARIFLVEDDGILAETTTLLLSKNGYEVIGVADTGKVAVESICRDLPDLVLMDIKLRGEMDGIQAAQAIRQEHTIPIIFITAYGAAAVFNRAKETQAPAFITKPFDENELCHSIELALQRSVYEKELVESERKYHDLFSQMLNGIALHEIVCDGEGNPVDYIFLDVNPAFEKLTGLLAENIVGKAVSEVLPDIEDHWIEAYGKVALTGEPVQFENYSGEVGKHFEIMSFSPKPGQFVCMFEDISERKRIQEERLKYQKLESIGILAGGIAHDFNNLLQSVFTNVSLTKMNVDAGSELYQRIEEIEKSLVKTKDLTHQLLTFSKGGTPVKEVSEVSELLTETVNFSLSGSNILLRMQLPDDLENVETDSGQISQVIQNLVINACASMPEGGTLEVIAQNKAVGPSDEMLYLSPGQYVAISFSDTGHGISKEDLPRIFDPYFTTKQSGSGLGLATSYSIMARHKGTITVDSDKEKGTTFTIYLPATVSGKPQKQSAKAVPLRTGEVKVLVMDDDENIRANCKEALNAFRYEVEVAANGEEAILLYEKAMHSGCPFNVVLLDLTIKGGMGGKETIRKLLEMDSDVKAIVSSGYSDDDIAGYKRAGFKYVLPKPYMLQSLIEAIQDAAG